MSNSIYVGLSILANVEMTQEDTAQRSLDLFSRLEAWCAGHDWQQTGLVFVATIVSAFIVRKWLISLLLKAASKTETPIDDEIIKRLRTPLYVTVLLVGTVWIFVDFFGGSLSKAAVGNVYSIAYTIAILFWAGVGSKIMTQLLTIITTHAHGRGILAGNMLPVFNFLIRIVVGLLAVYLVLKAWGADVTGWLASAGVLGVALGFGARDTLANLFAGVSILADTPFSKGDYITLEDGSRGHVTHVGIRSTRIETPDRVLVIVPNSVIANSRILNETAGNEGRRYRIRIPISVAYGNHPKAVEVALMSCVEGVNHLDSGKPHRVIMKEFGESGILFHLVVWLKDSGRRETVVDELNRRIYDALTAANIEIPFNKLDLYLKEMPDSKKGS
jgi:MscS family membrane protein